MREKEKKILAELKNTIENCTNGVVTLTVVDAQWLVQHVEYWDKMHDILET